MRLPLFRIASKKNLSLRFFPQMAHRILFPSAIQSRRDIVTEFTRKLLRETTITPPLPPGQYLTSVRQIFEPTRGKNFSELILCWILKLELLGT